MKKIKQSRLAIILFGIFLIILYHLIFPIIFASILKPLANSNNFFITNLVNILYYLLFAIFLILLYHKSLKTEWTRFWKNKKTFSKIGISNWLKGLILMVISNIMVLSITGNISGNEELNREILKSMPFFSFIVMCFLAPFIEEILFRFSFKNGFQKKYTYAIITSLIFASLHVLNSFDPLTFSSILENWKQVFFLIPYGTLAFFFALSYCETDSIFTSIMTHILHNSLSILIILISMWG